MERVAARAFQGHHAVRLVGWTMAFFLLAVGVAMALYPGSDAAAGRYRFFYDFVSALGVTRTPGGLDNHRSCVLFNASLGAAMLALLPYWYFRTGGLRGPRLLKALTFLCCAGFSLGVLGVALAPYDLNPHMHNYSIYTAFALIVPGILMLLLGSHGKLYGWRYKAAWVVFAAVLLGSELVLVRLVASGVLPSRPTNPVIQKVNLSAFFVWLLADMRRFSAFLGR